MGQAWDKQMPDLNTMNDDELLGLRFCDLELTIEGTWLEKCISRLYRELSKRNLSFHPPCFLADEWLCPDEEPIIGIAFFLAHPRLKRLEKMMMLETEGGTRETCMQLLRHETGHALNYAYLLHRRTRWRELFGPFTAEYPDRYRYLPYSKRFVRHLDDWYAQYHPDEDFAETFAVWLDPNSNWREEYADWPALDKLKYVDHIMKDIQNKQPKKTSGQKHWDATKMKSTLRTYYKKKRDFHAEDYPDFHDFYLNNMFPPIRKRDRMPAHDIIRHHRREILDYVSTCTREKKYVIDGILKDLSSRCRTLKLYAASDNTNAVMRLAIYVTTLTMNYSYTGSFRKGDS